MYSSTVHPESIESSRMAAWGPGKDGFKQVSPVLWTALACDWALEWKKELREARRVVVWKFCGGRRRRRRSWSRWTDADAGGLAFSDELRVFLSFSWKRKAKERRRSLHDLERRERENAVLFFPPFAFPRRSSSSSSSSARQQRRATNFNLRARHGAAGACAISSQPDRRTDGHALYLLSNSKPREERRGSTHSTQSHTGRTGRRRRRRNNHN